MDEENQPKKKNIGVSRNKVRFTIKKKSTIKKTNTSKKLKNWYKAKTKKSAKRIFGKMGL
jgi:hypothetical protein